MVAAWIVVGVPLIAQLALSRESPAGKEGVAEQDIMLPEVVGVIVLIGMLCVKV
jgi:hypothetical protein